MDLDMDYKDFFKKAFGKEPYNYQTEIAQDVFPSVINAPTGAGKTAMILGAWLWRRIRESNLEKEKRVGRRLIYCLPMRVLVEQTAKVAQDAVQRLEEAGVVEKGRFRVYVLMGGDATGDWNSDRKQGETKWLRRQKI
jgi:CRISPR-associated endonuclease/helicase Cas3